MTTEKKLIETIDQTPEQIAGQRDILMAKLVKANGLIENLRAIIKGREVMFQQQQLFINLRDKEIADLRRQLESSPANIPEGWPTEEMKEAFKTSYKHGSIWTDRLTAAIEAMLSAPTPPAQEDEPVAWMRHRLVSGAGGLGGGVAVEFSEHPFGGFDDPAAQDKDATIEPLYTRPGNSGLRKAAEEVVTSIRTEVDNVTFANALENLRSTLETSETPPRKIIRKGDVFKATSYGWVQFKGFDYHFGQKTAMLYSSEYRDTYYPLPERIEQDDNVEFVDL